MRLLAIVNFISYNLIYYIITQKHTKWVTGPFKNNNRGIIDSHETISHIALT